MGSEATLYRAVAARLNYLAPDRPDIAFSVKEAARARSKARRFKKEATKCLERLQMLKSLTSVAVQALVAKERAAKVAEAEAARMASA